MGHSIKQILNFFIPTTKLFHYILFHIYHYAFNLSFSYYLDGQNFVDSLFWTCIIFVDSLAICSMMSPPKSFSVIYFLIFSYFFPNKHVSNTAKVVHFRTRPPTTPLYDTYGFYDYYQKQKHNQMEFDSCSKSHVISFFQSIYSMATSNTLNRVANDLYYLLILSDFCIRRKFNFL
jgi:hypothetical protein